MIWMLAVAMAGDIELDEFDEVQIAQISASASVQSAEKVRDSTDGVEALLRYATDRNTLVIALLASQPCRPPVDWELPSLEAYEKADTPDTLVPACVRSCDCDLQPKE